MFENMIAKRVIGLGTEKAFEVLSKCKELEAQGKNIIHLQIGEPDFDTPKNIVEAGVNALRNGYTHYTPNSGMIEVKQAIVDYVKKYRNIETDKDEVVVVPGGKPTMFFTILALVESGDEVIYPNPGYPIYESLIRFVGGVPVPMPLVEENDFRVNIEDLSKKITSKTKMIIINSPANPTGGILTKDDLSQIADLIRGKGIFVLSDEIYSRIVYDGDPVSIATMPGMKDYTIILDGFSKTYAMTGWRLGFGIMHKEIAKKVDRLIANSTSNTAAFTQLAGKEALEGPQTDVDNMIAEFRRRRDYIVDRLNSIEGISCKKPEGAFYVFPNIKGTGLKSEALADYLLNEANVAVLDGASFGEYGEGHIRLSYATSMENIEEALNRIEKALKLLKNK
ncbi:pyridoxal phosphate-dependent aminotransferase [Clostridium sp.]|jgi:aspartate/methionine/tyrosine aminotransferase|uniref:pyridoxal phosphate-dependent aminotransferase n=1 Tax=Clostridium sp. TaxID=1506 RepID=UPI00258850F1|nr:pyridoxal phosphate-dependent aminotransferase [Clostridium sp.]MDF2505288.1 aminotransferase [Clostridium sp.]